MQNSLTDRVAGAYRLYAAARPARGGLPNRDHSKGPGDIHTVACGFQGRAIRVPAVIQAQRALAEAKLEYNRALGDSWKGAAQLSGLLLEESWPDPPREPQPPPAPSPLPTPSTGKPGP